MVGGLDVLANIKALREQQALLRAERKRVSRWLRNEEKRKSRLRKRARQLSDADLLTVLRMRSETTPVSDPAPAP
jgi:lipid II:glycine glycyltransferase (peptidoglycan interpeptide bridge formation enzyme)